MPRNADPRILHAVFQPRLSDLLARCTDNELPMGLYEGARSPVRQVELYARGRVAGAPDFGKTVTRAKAWSSFHQFGLAADVVFHVNGRWTWDEPKIGAWDLFTRIAADCGLRTLSFERPHVEMPVMISALQTGHFPAGGGDAWMEWLETEIENWGREARTIGGIVHPGAPPLPSISDRPPLANADGLHPGELSG